MEFDKQIQKLDKIVRKCPICFSNHFSTAERYYINHSSGSPVSKITNVAEINMSTPTIILVCKKCHFVMHFISDKTVEEELNSTECDIEGELNGNNLDLIEYVSEELKTGEST